MLRLLYISDSIEKHTKEQKDGIVGCRGVTKRGSFVPVLRQQVPLRYKAINSLLFKKNDKGLKSLDF